MPTFVITQDDVAPDIQQTSNLTMAILPKVAKKKLVQRSFYFEKMTKPKMAAPPQETRKIPISECMHGSSRISAHNRTIKVNNDGNKNDTKIKIPKKKNQKPKHSAFSNKKDDSMDAKLASKIDVEQNLAFVHSLRK